MAGVPFKAVATGVLQFGLAAIPIKVVKATESQDRATQVKQVHKSDGGEVGRKNYCKSCQAEVPTEEIGKAVSGVQFDEDILDQFKVPSDKAIVVDGFVPLDTIDLRLFDEPRYIVPDKAGHGPLRAFTETMQDRAEGGAPVAAIAKMAEREHEKVVAIYAIAPIAGETPVLVASILRRAEQIRDTGSISAELATGTAPTAQVKNMVNALIDAMFEPFLDVTKYKDEKAELRDKTLREIASGAKPVAGPSTPEPKATADADLMATLMASVAAAGSKSKSPNGEPKATTKAKGKSKSK